MRPPANAIAPAPTPTPAQGVTEMGAPPKSEMTPNAPQRKPRTQGSCSSGRARWPVAEQQDEEEENYTPVPAAASSTFTRV